MDSRFQVPQFVQTRGMCVIKPSIVNWQVLKVLVFSLHRLEEIVEDLLTLVVGPQPSGFYSRMPSNLRPGIIFGQFCPPFHFQSPLIWYFSRNSWSLLVVCLVSAPPIYWYIVILITLLQWRTFCLGWRSFLLTFALSNKVSAFRNVPFFNDSMSSFFYWISCLDLLYVYSR